MEEQPRDAENTTRAFFKEYMVNRNVEATLDWLMDDVQWIGTGKGEYSCGKEQVLKALDQEFSLDPDAYQIIWEDIKESRLTSDCAVMQGRLTVVRILSDGKNFAMGVRVTSTCVRTAKGFKVASIHASVPADFQEEGEFFPLSFAESVSEEYARRMGRSALELLGKMLNLPEPPKRMESFDISNTGKSDIVASMVVYSGTRPLKSAYRRFRIQSLE